MNEDRSKSTLHKPVIGSILATCAMAALAQQGDGTDVQVTAHIYKPALVAATDVRTRSLKLPDGFKLTVFAEGMKNVRILAVSAEGRVYISRREQGDVVLLVDDDGDGRADSAGRVVLNRAGAHGLAIHDRTLYVATAKEVFAADINEDGTLQSAKLLMGDLPDTGQHPNRTLQVGPDNALYISVGSTCNACNEANPESAALLRASLDGSSRTIFATGLRNTIGFAWHPDTGQLWGLDHGIDYLGDDEQPEELNLIEHGKRYGWPHVWGKGDFNPQSSPPGGLSKEQWKALSTPMVLGYTAHAAPMQMIFYSGAAFPREYIGDAFATMRGSWNRRPASGYEVVRIRYRDGAPHTIEPFLTGFLSDGGTTHFGRPVGLVQTHRGALLLSDDANGMIYHISHSKKAGTSKKIARPPARAMQAQMAAGVGVSLAIQRIRASTTATILVKSSAFEPEGAIPVKHSEYADGISPPLEWTAVEGAKSYVLIMEDPDAKPVTPFVHWVAWNIPANVTHLPEGLQEQERLTDPEGLLQGRTSRGSPAYFGPRPPAGDPPHHYHFQVFALDTMIDVPPGSNRDDVLAKIEGHVIAAGEIIGLFAQQQKPQK